MPRPPRRLPRARLERVEPPRRAVGLVLEVRVGAADRLGAGLDRLADGRGCVLGRVASRRGVFERAGAARVRVGRGRMAVRPGVA